MARERSMRSALFAWGLTRLLVFSLMILTAQLDRGTGGTVETTREVKFSLAKLPVARLLRQTMIVADANWYVGIAENGYEKMDFKTDSTHNWAFFPLHPLLWGLAHKLTGEFAMTGIVLVNLLLLFALYLLHKTVLEFGYDAGVADRAVFYAAAFPVSYFYSMPLSESLFLLLTVGNFYAARRGRWGWAGATGALAAATRVTGVVLLPALIILYWQTHRRVWPPTRYLALFLIPSGLLAFMCHLYIITGNPLAFKDITVTWGRQPVFFLKTLWLYLKEPQIIASSWDFRLLNFAAAILVLVCGAVLAKWREWSLALFTFASAFVALSSGLLQSQARYAMVVFPIFIVLAVATRRLRASLALGTASLILLCLMTLLFTLHYSMVMS